MHISDWSSDVCSSDLNTALPRGGMPRLVPRLSGLRERCRRECHAFRRIMLRDRATGLRPHAPRGGLTWMPRTSRGMTVFSNESNYLPSSPIARLVRAIHAGVATGLSAVNPGQSHLALGVPS